MALTSTGVVVGQEESPAPEASMAPSASPQPEAITPSTLGMMQVATDKTAGTKLKGKKYTKAVKKLAPNAVAYLAAAGGGDAADRVIQTVLMARAIDAAGDLAGADNYKVADAYIGLATAIYRNGWTAAGTGPIEFNAEINQAVTERYAGQDGLAIDWPEGTLDICVMAGEDWIFDPAVPWSCAQEGAIALRVDASFVDDSKNGTKELYSGPSEGLDVGFALHQVAQNERANTPLKGKEYRKAIAAKAPAIAEYVAAGSGAGRISGIIDLVLLAREADEAGDAKAAKAFMSLAKASYRVAWATEGLSPLEFNKLLYQLVVDERPGEPELQVFPIGEDVHDVCHFTKKQLKKTGEEGDWAPNWENDPWLCDQMGGTVLRVTGEEVEWHYGGHES